MAWAHDDYGDRHTSRQFFDNVIPEDQRKAAEATRRLIQENVGSFSDLSLALKNPRTVSEEKLLLARNLSVFSAPAMGKRGGREGGELVLPDQSAGDAD